MTASRADCRCTLWGMDNSTNGHHPTTDSDSFDGLPTGWRWTLPRALGFLAFLLAVLFWIYVFANGDSIAHPDEFDDPVFVEAAETICAKRQAAIAEFPLATAAEDPVNRGELVALGTEQLALMVTELGELALPTDPKGADGVPQWLADYELYLNDRRRYSSVLATGDDPAFTISGNAQGVRVTDLLRTFAEVNEMDSCAPSGDA